MPSFKYFALTANCGNDSIGLEASKQIVSKMQREEADFVVLNCQEVDFDKTKAQLEQMLKGMPKDKKYRVSCLTQMPTHTKLETQFHSHTGITTFVIHQDNLTLNIEHKEVARRSQSRFDGRSYNKGGVVTDFTLTRENTAESVRVQAISGHLDANKVAKRNQDWLNLHKASSAAVTTWDELVKVCADVKIAGYDANTRNKRSATGESVNLLVEAPNESEVQALHLASLGNRQFSAEITYGEGKNEEDPKRPGYTKNGMLDFVSVSDGGYAKEVSTASVATIDVEKSTKRDHKVVISPIQEVPSLTPFQRVVSQISSSLDRVAPQLANKVRSLPNNEHSHEYLLNLYKSFLSKDGLLNKAIELHGHKLASYERLTEATFIKDPQLTDKIKVVFFNDPHWCEGSDELIEAKQNLMRAFLESIDYCQLESGIAARLELYTKLSEALKDFGKILPRDAFKELALEEYKTAFMQFEQQLEQSKNAQLKDAAQAILAQLKIVADPEDHKKLIDPKSLDKLTRIAIQCQRACEAVDSPEAAHSLPEIMANLDALSEEAISRSSLLWQGLSAMLKGIVQIIEKITGIEMNHEKDHKEKLEDNVYLYKKAIHELEDPELNNDSGCPLP